MHDARQRMPIGMGHNRALRPDGGRAGTGRDVGTDVDAAAAPVLDWLRRTHARQRTRARLDLAALAQVTGGEAVQPEVLVGALHDALGRSPRIYRPGSPETSFDEAWLLALIAAWRRGDRASAAFLLRRRVRAPVRHAFNTLGRAAIRGLDPIWNRSILSESQPRASQSPMPRSSR